MKKPMRIGLMIGLFQMGCHAGMAENAGKGAVLIEGGSARAKIYVSGQLKEAENNKKGNAPPQTLQQYHEFCKRLAVKDLNYHLQQMSGAGLEIVQTENPADVKAPAVVLGDLAVKMGAKPAVTTETGEAFRILSRDGLALIGGESDAGMLCGVYELLDRLGCDWIMPGEIGEVIPERKTVVVPDMDETQKPAFALRAPWYSYGAPKEREEFDLWKLRHKNQPQRGVFPLLSMEGGHVWDTLIRKYKKEFDEDPTMLALVGQPDGTFKRQGPQVETTHPKVIDLFERYIQEMFEKNKWPKDQRACVGIGPADGFGYSESAESLAAGSGRRDPLTGLQDVTDLLILLCNQLLERMSKDYPNLHLGFYLYNVHADYPMRYKPHPRVMIVIADINYSRLHSILDANSRSRSYYKGILEQWKKLHKEQGNPILFRGYNFNLAECLLPYTKLKIWGEDLPFYKEMGCGGTYVQWDKNWSVTGPSDYLEAKLNWDTSLDWKKTLKKYCAHAFGKGAPFMEKYYLLLVEKQHGAGLEAGSYHSFDLIYDPAFIQDAKTLFDSAARAADAEKNKTLIAYSREPVEMLEIYLAYRRAFTAFDFVKAKAHYDQMFALWQKYHDLNSNLVGQWAINFLKRFHQRFIEEGLKYSTGDYRIVYPLPDRLKTMLDPYVKGQEMGFHRPEINDSRFIVTSTWGVPWDAQGLGGYFNGALWYRVPVEIPPALKGKPVGLFMGGVDSIARVWLNGKYIGSAKGFSVPFLFDLTDEVKFGGKNLLAIQVQHTSVNELGTFGLVYPAFIFTGPRLERKAPLEQRLRRVLPGGELGDHED